jgi:hypothetical protein
LGFGYRELPQSDCVRDCQGDWDSDWGSCQFDSGFTSEHVQRFPTAFATWCQEGGEERTEAQGKKYKQFNVITLEDGGNPCIHNVDGINVPSATTPLSETCSEACPPATQPCYVHNGAGNTGVCGRGNEMNEQQCKDFAAASGYTFHTTGSCGTQTTPTARATRTAKSGELARTCSHFLAFSTHFPALRLAHRFNTDQDTQGTWRPDSVGQWCKRNSNTCSTGVTGN